MVKVISINDSNDIFMATDGNLSMSAGVEAIEQACKTATQAQLGEMVLETGLGIPNFQALWNGTPDYNIWRGAIITTLQNVQGVTQVNSLIVTPDSDTVNYVAEIMTIFSNQSQIITG